MQLCIMMARIVKRFVSDLMRKRRKHAVDAQYERAYAGVQDPLGEDFEGWDEEGVGTRHHMNGDQGDRSVEPS